MTPVCVLNTTKNVCTLWVSLLTQARLTTTNNIPETQNPLAKTFFVMLNSKNEWQGMEFFLFIPCNFPQSLLINSCFHCDCTRREAKSTCHVNVSHSIIVITQFNIKVSLQKHPFLLALRHWGRFTRSNVCNSATEIPYRWCKICPESGQKRWLVDRVVTLF